MIKKICLAMGFFVVFCLLLVAHADAMGVVPPLSTGETTTKPTASEEALARQQIENLRNISVNSETVQEGYAKFVQDVYAGKRYLYAFNDLAKKELLRIASDKNENWKFRFIAISSLSPDDPPEAFDVRREILEDKSERIELRRIAIGSIPSTKRLQKQKEAVDILIGALEDSDDDIVGSAANGLGELQDKKAIGPLIVSLKASREYLNKLLRDGWKEYKKGTSVEGGRLRTPIRALGSLKAKEAVPVLIEVMESKNYDKQFLDTIIAFAVNALGDIADESASPALNKALNEQYSDNDMHHRIKTAIRKIRGE